MVKETDVKKFDGCVEFEPELSIERHHYDIAYLINVFNNRSSNDTTTRFFECSIDALARELESRADLSHVVLVDNTSSMMNKAGRLLVRKASYGLAGLASFCEQITFDFVVIDTDVESNLQRVYAVKIPVEFKFTGLKGAKSRRLHKKFGSLRALYEYEKKRFDSCMFDALKQQHSDLYSDVFNLLSDKFTKSQLDYLVW